MPMVIYLRKIQSQNYFRDILIGSLATGCGNRALICSGFFQEQFKGSAYKASDEAGFRAALDKHRIDLELVGIHNASWIAAYRRFRDNVSNSKVRKVTAYYKSALRWHAKVYILFQNDEPIFGIIGSSNMTRTAFGTEREFNRECDVVLWPSRRGRIPNLMSQAIAGVEDPHAIIRSPYRAQENRGVSIAERLRNLEAEIKDSTQSILQ